MKKLFTILFITLGILALAVMIGTVAFLMEWSRCAETKSVPEITETVFQTKKHIEIGEKIPCTFHVRTSWSLMPAEASFTPPEGTQEGDSAEIVPEEWHWGTRDWTITVWIQPFRDGEIPETPVRILCEGGPDGKIEITGKIPGFTVHPAAFDPQKDLEIASEVVPAKEEPFHWIWYLITGLILLAIAAWLIFRWKQSQKTPPEPFWVTALNKITNLQNLHTANGITPEAAVICLTDIVRNFLEKQFSLRAERQTTSEFLFTLQNDNSPLDVEQRRFLREFLSAADMIKFARLPADDVLFNDAAMRAESLIRNTAGAADQKEVKK